MDATESRRLHAAWRTLFGAGPGTPDLDALSSAALRGAWRREAFRTHPDRVAGASAKRRATDRFVEAARAYELLGAFLERAQRRPPRVRPARGPAGEGARAHRRPGPVPRLPPRPLPLGEFLWRSRCIPIDALVGALVWQRRQRERFCEVCVRWRLLGAAEAATLLAGRAPGEPSGQAARRLRLLTEAQVGAVLAFQRRRQRPLGEYFVERGHLSAAALGAQLARHAAHNASCPRPRRHR